MSVELGNELKGMISGYIEAKKLSDVSVATVIDPSGPIIQIEGNEGPLPAAAVSVPDYLSEYDVEISGTFHGEEHSGTLTINNGLKRGDRVYISRKTGGQKFVIIGRVQ